MISLCDKTFNNFNQNSFLFKNILYLCPTYLKSGCGEMVDTLVSGASASRRVGSTPIIRTHKSLMIK